MKKRKKGYQSPWLKEWWSKIQEILDDWDIGSKEMAYELDISSDYYRQMRKGTATTNAAMRKRIRDVINRINPSNEFSLLIDYVRIRFPKSDLVTMETIAEKVLNLPWMTFEKSPMGWGSYKIRYDYGHIILCESMEENQGIILEMRGQGCRQYELYLVVKESSWIEFFQRVFLYDGVWKRFDLAINDHYGVLDIHALYEKCLYDELRCVFKKFSLQSSGELRNGEKIGQGETLYLGTFSSEIYFCIYEKDYEQYVKKGIPIEEAIVKNRFEVRLFNERAETTVRELLEKQNNEAFWEYVVYGIINQYVCFLRADYKKPKQEWDIDPIWNHFIGAHRERIRLAMQPEPFSKWRTLNWISHQCAPTIKGLLLDDIAKGKHDVVDILNNAKANTKMQKILAIEKDMYAQVKLQLSKIGYLYIADDSTDNSYPF